MSQFSPMFSIYRTKSACQFQIQKRVEPKGDVGNEFLEYNLLVTMAPGENRKYRFSTDKIVIQLGVNEVSALGLAMSTLIAGGKLAKEFKLVHDPNKGREGEGKTIKTLYIQTMDNGTVFFGMSMKDGDKQSSISIPLGASDMNIIRVISDEAIACMVGMRDVVLREKR